MLGRLDLDVDAAAHKLRSAKWTKIPITADITPAPDVQKAVDQWEGKVHKLVDVPIGESTKAMKRTDPELRLLIEKAMAEEMHADIGFIGSGNLREALPLGKIQARAIWNMLPFDDEVVVGKFKGSALPPTITSRHPVDPNREYTVVTTEFTEQSQSAKTELATTGMVFPKKGPVQRDVVLAWFKRKKIVP
jgi:2',3'-cyclic-nucleotide 2'-phosphodiesterase (5'-nucleotidase family)